MSPGLCSKRSAAAAPPVVIHRRDADVYGEKRRREEEERRARAGARGPGPPPAPGRWPHLSAAASYVVSRDGGRAALHSYAAEAGSGAGNGNGSAGLGGTWSCGARGDGGCGGHGTRCPGDLMPSPPGNRTAGPLLRCRGGGRHGPTHSPVLGEPRGRRPGGVRVFCGTGRDAAQRWGQCGTRGQCVEMATVRNMGTACRDGHPEPRSPARCQGCPPREGRAVRVRTEPSVPSLYAPSHAPQPRCAVAPCRRRAQLRL